MTSQLARYLKKFGNLKRATSLQRSNLHDLSGGQQSLEITDYAISHMFLILLDGYLNPSSYYYKHLGCISELLQ